MHSLPSVKNIEAYHAWRADVSRCLPAALDIARGHGLPHGDPHLYSTGTNLVIALDDALVLKVFPPHAPFRTAAQQAHLIFA
jgi:hygromycin-B 7''-O-kinase